MIAICPNPYRDTELELTLKLRSLLEENGFTVGVFPVFSDPVEPAIPEGIETRDISYLPRDTTLVIIVGGDGTTLAVARNLKYKDLPLLCVNLGTKGFMASLEPEDSELNDKIIRAARGEEKLSRRMCIDIDLIRDGKIIYSDSALNDAVIHGYGDTIRINAKSDENTVLDYSGDGIVIATPTGSTGYSMSAGGPIVEPESENIILTPICAHALGAKTYVLTQNREVTVKTQKLHTRKAYLAIDGNSIYDLQSEDIIRVRRSGHCIYLVDFAARSFFEIVAEKLQ